MCASSIAQKALKIFNSKSSTLIKYSLINKQLSCSKTKILLKPDKNPILCKKTRFAFPGQTPNSKDFKVLICKNTRSGLRTADEKRKKQNALSSEIGRARFKSVSQNSRDARARTPRPLRPLLRR